MKTTIVPAQVTTVEDKIAGNIGMSQLLLLITPIFIGSILFVVLPPFFSYSTYKVVLIFLLSFVCASLAIRIHGKILMYWLIVLARYNLRPKFYVFNKNDVHLREPEFKIVEAEEVKPVLSEDADAKPTVALSLPEIVSAENIVSHPSANFRLEFNKKGKLSGHITEIQ